MLSCHLQVVVGALRKQWQIPGLRPEPGDPGQWARAFCRESGPSSGTRLYVAATQTPRQLRPLAASGAQDSEAARVAGLAAEPHEGGGNRGILED